MPALVDDWTGANGATWSVNRWEDWFTAGTLSTMTIQGNAGRFLGDSGYNGVSARLLMPGDRANQDWTVALTPQTSAVEWYAEIWARSTTGRGGNGGNLIEPLGGYMLNVSESVPQLELWRYDAAGATRTFLDGQPITATGALQFMRLQAIGSLIQAKWWSGTLASEPGTWLISQTDATIAAGRMHLALVTGAAVVTRYIDWDNLIDNTLPSPVLVKPLGAPRHAAIR